MGNVIFKIIVSSVLFFVLAPADAFPLDETPQRAGQTASIDVRDADIKDVLLTLGKTHGINIIVDDTVKGSVSLNVSDVPVGGLIDSIITAGKLKARRTDSGVIIVESDAASAEVGEARGGIIVMQYRLNYIESPSEVKGAVKSVLSASGNVAEVTGQNAIVISDNHDGIERAKTLLGLIDRRPALISIEARIVEVKSSHTRELGIDWGFGYGYTSSDVLGRYGRFDSSYGVNLPASSAKGASIGIGAINDRISLDIKLSALEENGTARILSSPRVLVMDSRKAVIASGTEIVIPNAVGVSLPSDVKNVSFGPSTAQAVLKLAVTPRASANGEHIALSIETKREEFDFSKDVQGYPPKQTNFAATDLLVKNSGTIVIGGINMSHEAEREAIVPLFGRLPLIGWLFRHNIKQKEETELLIFLTPTIEQGI